MQSRVNGALRCPRTPRWHVSDARPGTGHIGLPWVQAGVGRAHVLISVACEGCGSALGATAWALSGLASCYPPSALLAAMCSYQHGGLGPSRSAVIGLCRGPGKSNRSMGACASATYVGWRSVGRAPLVRRVGHGLQVRADSIVQARPPWLRSSDHSGGNGSQGCSEAS